MGPIFLVTPWTLQSQPCKAGCVRALTSLCYQAFEVLGLEALRPSHHVMAAQAGCDVTSVPRKSLLRLLAEHCADPGERHALLRLCSSGGRAEYATQVRPLPKFNLNVSFLYPDGPGSLLVYSNVTSWGFGWV